VFVGPDALTTVLRFVAFRSWILRHRSATPTAGDVHVVAVPKTALDPAPTRNSEEGP
jgi:hypothetical protein